MREQVDGQLTLFQAGFLASRFPLPGSSEARRMTATSGQKWLGLSRNCGQLGLLEKMLLESCEWHSPIFYLNWKPVDIGQGHFLYQLALSEPDTDGTGLQLWATPNTMDYLPQRSAEALERQAQGSRKGRTRPANLREQVNPQTIAMWPTPKASDYKGSGPAGSKSAQHDLKHGNLKGAVMFATPQARDFRTGQASRWEDREHRSRNLNDQIAMFPAPTTGAGMCGGTGNFQQLKKLEENGVITETERKNMSQGNGVQLNPNWVEWLMGFPIGWTEI